MGADHADGSGHEGSSVRCFSDPRSPNDSFKAVNLIGAGSCTDRGVDHDYMEHYTLDLILAGTDGKRRGGRLAFVEVYSGPLRRVWLICGRELCLNNSLIFNRL